MDFDTTQLKSLEAEYRQKADYFKLAADLQEQGYKTDQARIDTEVQKAKDDAALQVQTLTQSLTQENTTLKNENFQLKQQLASFTNP